MLTENTNTSFKRIRSVSAKIFSITNNQPNFYPSHQTTTSNKRISCQISNKSSWFPRIRCRSTSSASSTFSLVFNNQQPSEELYIEPQQQYPTSNSLLESLSSELESLYSMAKEEIDYAIESQGSIYYEGDKMTAQNAFDACELKYKQAMEIFGDTTNAIKFRFRWETDLYQLHVKISNLPSVTTSIYN